MKKEVKLIADKDQDCFDVLLLSYHNSTQSLQGYKYLYLSCIYLIEGYDHVQYTT